MRTHVASPGLQRTVRHIKSGRCLARRQVSSGQELARAVAEGASSTCREVRYSSCHVKW